MAHSQKHAMLVDTAGLNKLQFDFETIFGQNEGKPIVQIFVYGDNVFSVFALGNKLVIYRDIKFDSEVSLDSIDIEVLEMIVDSPMS